MSGRRSLPLVAFLALALAACLGVWAMMQRGDTVALDPVGPGSRLATPSEPSAIGTQPATRPATRPAPTAQPVIGGRPDLITDPARQKGMLRLPDGTFVAPLNGAVDPPAVQFRAGRPWAPIVAKGSGTWPDLGYLDYYIHADGTKTCTFKSPISRAGVTKIESVTLVSHPDDSPVPKIPVLAGEGEGTGTEPPPKR